VLDKCVDPSGEGGCAIQRDGTPALSPLNVRSSLKNSAAHSLAYDVDKSVIFLSVIE
jgi:hypothetical protein